MEPTFIIGGAQRCGTTALCYLLDAHPQIYVARPLKPEPKYFLAPPTPPRDRDWYLRTWFGDTGGAIAAGEKSTSYLETKGVAERIKAQFPALKLIFLLRHPVERAVSNYRFSVESGLERESFDYAVRHEAQRLASTDFPGISSHPFAYVRRGRYAEQLERFFGCFDRRAIQIVLREDLQARPAEVCRQLYRFLGVDEGPLPGDLSARYNQSSTGALELLPSTLEYLFEQFREPNRRLAELLERDLDRWDEPTPALISWLQHG